MTTKNLLINVVSVTGTGVVYWEGQGGYYFNLHGVDDRLSLTTGNSNTINKLCFENTTEAENEKDPGFLFYLTYYPRTVDYNCDQLKIGKSTEFGFRNTDFPINFIVPLKGLETDVHASLNFYGYEDDKMRTRWYNEKEMLSIWGMILSEEDAYNARLSNYAKPQKNNNAVDGTFDGSLNVAFLSFNKKDLEKFNDLKDKNPYLFFSVEKTAEDKFKFSKII